LGFVERFKRKKEEEPYEPTAPRHALMYVKALSIQDLSDLDHIKREFNQGNIIILKVTPLAKKNLDDVKKAISFLTSCVREAGGDIARLGEERVLITPPSVKIWKKDSQARESSGSISI
jgi:SepF-like predicted cell division protein (DUF552 family)